MAHVRNREGIQFAELRAVIDRKFEALHDSLEEAYYQFWREGLSRPWHGFDVQPTPADSKALFDRLHGAIWWAYAVHFDAENAKRAEPYPAGKYNWIDEATGKTRVQLCKERISAMTPAERTKLAMALSTQGVVIATV